MGLTDCHLRLRVLFFGGGLLWSVGVHPVWAQPIQPHGFVKYHSEERGQDGHTSLGVRIPLTRETASFFFLEPHLKIFDNGSLGSSVIVGWRTLRRKDLFGTFIGYDNRDVLGRVFHQLSVGAEYKRERFGAYVTGFLPIGRRQADAGLGTVLDANFFDGPFYVFERRERRFNSTMAGWEIAVDTTIPVGPDYMRPRLGVYYLESPYTSTVGVKGEIRYDHAWFNLGLGVQHDRVFDTRVSFQVGINLPGHPRQPQAPTLAQRLYEPVEKPSTIIVQNVAEGITDILAINPDTNQPYQFYIVTDNPAGLRGTPMVFPGTPAGLTAALSSAAGASGNGVTYIYQKNSALAPLVGSFSVGDGVKLVSSSAPVANFFNRSLPFIAQRGVGGPPVDFDSFLTVNDGQPLPQIQGNIQLVAGGNRQAVVGLAINPNSASAGISGTNNSNPVILSNKITDAQDTGIALKNASSSIGSFTLSIKNQLVKAGDIFVVNNQVEKTTSSQDARGILVTVKSGSVTVADSRISDTIAPDARGIRVEAIGNTNSISILNSHVQGTTGQTKAVGIDVTTQGGDVATVTIGGTNTVNDTKATAGGALGDGASGVAISTQDTIQVVNITGSNTIQNTQADFDKATALGLAVTTIAPGSTIGQVNVSANNTISNTTTLATVDATAGGIGIFTTADNSTIGVVNITGNNTISQTKSGDQAGGIGVTTNGANSSIGSVSITGNNVITDTQTSGFRAIGLVVGTTGANSKIANGGVINITGSHQIVNTEANPLGNSVAFGAAILTNFNANNATIAQNGTINIENLDIQNTSAFNGAAGLGIVASATASSIASSGVINVGNIKVNNVTAVVDSSGISIATGFPGFLFTNQTIGDIRITGQNTISNILATATAAGISVRVPPSALNSTVGNITIGSANPTERTSVQDVRATGVQGRAYGIEVQTGIGSTFGDVTIRNSDVSTSGQVKGTLAARGIVVQAGITQSGPTPGNMGNVSITGNQVGSPISPVEVTATSFRDAIGILVRAVNNNTIGDLTIQGNTVNGVIANAGSRAQGIVANAVVSNLPGGSPRIGTVTPGAPSVIIRDNSVTAGNATTLTTDGILLGTELLFPQAGQNPEIGRALVANNTINVQSANLVGQAGATGIRIYNDNLAIPNPNHVNVDILNNTINFSGGNFAPTGSPNDGSSSGVFVQANTGTATRPVCVRIAGNASTTPNALNTHFRFLHVAGGVALFNATPNPITTNAQLGTFLTTGAGNTVTGGASAAFSHNPTIPAINSTICPNY
ncbi:MAG: hypothetical protein Q6L55_07760 [Gloeomargarita sp. SRBZ-1_bins_9]